MRFSTPAPPGKCNEFIKNIVRLDLTYREEKLFPNYLEDLILPLLEGAFGESDPI